VLDQRRHLGRGPELMFAEALALAGHLPVRSRNDWTTCPKPRDGKPRFAAMEQLKEDSKALKREHSGMSWEGEA
jgi:hypothetical protein